MEIASFAKLFKTTLLAGLILLDKTGLFKDPGDKEPATRCDTGQRVEILQERGPFYQVKKGNEALWISKEAVLVLGPRRDSDSLPLDFYRRASKNRDEEARALGAGGLMRLLKGRQLVAEWSRLQRDPSDAVRCSANEVFSLRTVREDARFHAALTDALLRVKRDGGWHEGALCGLGEVLSRSSHPDKTELRFMLAIRGLSEALPQDPDVPKVRRLLKQGLTHPEPWVRGNLIGQVIRYDHTWPEVTSLLTELFPSMSPEDKAAVIDNDYSFKDDEDGRPLMRLILDLIEDKSQPVALRMHAASDWNLTRPEKRKGIYRVLSDPGDGLRLELAAKFCRYRDVLEETANNGDDRAFASALMCLDRAEAGRTPASVIGPGREYWREQGEAGFSEWLAPDLAAGLESVTDEVRREQLEPRLRCLTGESVCPVTLSAAAP